MRRWLGIDINGWMDTSARDWEPDGAGALLEEVKVLQGGVEGVAIKGQQGSWVGGPQALLSPHGRGAGWGRVGALERRFLVRDLWKELVTGVSAEALPPWYAAVEALSKSAQAIVVNVPDTASFDEGAQSRALQALQGRKRPRPMLLWRSVALFLEAFAQGIIPRSAERTETTVLVHSEEGLEIQRFTLRRVDDFVDHYAPERDGYGHVIFPELSLDALRARVLTETLALNEQLRDSRTESTRLPAQLLFGEARPGDQEILRRNNGTWMEVFAPAIPADLFPNLDGQALPSWVSERTLFCTPLEPQLATDLASKLKACFPDLELVPWEYLSRGALRAGRLIEKGLPHYLDHLTPISLAVLEQAGPTFRSLMPASATVPANREYISDAITGLRWGRGKNKIEFFVLKGDSEVRHWTVLVPEPPEHDVNVELRLKQTPGQSWAKLSLISPDWPELQTIELEWDRLDPDARTPEEVLKTLDRPSPVIPIRIVEEAHIIAWEDDSRSTGLSSILTNASKEKTLQLKPLAVAIRRNKWLPEYGRSFKTISTDGQVPHDLPEEITHTLDAALQKVGDLILEVASKRRPSFKDNAALLFTTWAFGRCPVAVQEQLVEALEQEQFGTLSPLLIAPQSKTVVIAGAGRAVKEVHLIARLITTLAQRPMNSTVLGALSSVLSRRANAPHALSAPVVEKLAQKLVNVLQELKNQQSFQIKFKNALLSLTGLLRYREVEPWALVRNRSVQAEQAAHTLEQIYSILAQRQSQIPQGAKKLAIVADLIDLLSGRGGDPNILRHIDELSEDDAE